MNIDIQKWAPWNWFKNEDEEHGGNVQVQGKKESSLPTHYNSGNPLLNLHREMDKLFEQAFQGFGMPSLGSSTQFPQSLLKPNVDIKEGKKNYVIFVEVPGVEESDIKLELANGALTISGEKKHEKEDKDENYHCIERSYGSFRRVLTLPQDVSEDDIKAKFKNGVLQITVPRKQIAKPKTETKVIDIKNAA